MASFRSNRGGVRALLGLVLLLIAFTAAGCVEPFGGSNINFSLEGGVHVPGTPGDFGRPPPDTHYEFHAVEYVKDVDDDGNEIIVQTFTYEIANFELRELIERESPCFIEDDESRFPGLHSTMYAEKLRDVLGFDDPYDPPATAKDVDVIDILTADRRMGGLGLIQNGLVAVTSHDPAEYPDDIPAPDLMDDASNAERKQKCEAFWKEHPNKYEGNDMVFTLPLNGQWFGAVHGADPRNGVLIGGSKFYVDADLADIDGLLMNWQYDCTPEAYQAEGMHCTPDYPTTVPDDQRTDLGVHYMSGDVVEKARGVLNVPMRNRVFGTVAGEAVIFPDLDNDQVQF